MRLTLLLLLLTSQLSAATHYIWSGASGAGTGADFTNAWTTIGSHVSVRGDTYVISGGTYNESPTINIALSGTTVTTLRKANASQDSAVAGWTSTLASVVAQINGQLDLDKGYVTVDGITGSGTSGYGIVIYNSAASNVVTLENANGFSVSHCEIQGKGVSSSALAFVGINWNNVAAVKKNTYIGYNWIHEVTTNGIQVLGAVGTSYADYGMLFENNFVSETGLCTNPDNHGQAMQLGQASEMGYCIVRNNTFRNNSGSAIISFLTSGNGANHHDIEIYNNIGYLTDTTTYPTLSPGVIWHEAAKTYTGCALTNLLIANNNFYNITGNSNLGQVVLELSTSGNVLENNVWEGCQFTATHTGLTTQSNNGYYGNNGAGIPSGTTNQVNGASTTFANASSFNFSLIGAGYAVGAGLDLSSSFTTDAAGLTRTVPWDLGAYKYIASVYDLGLSGSAKLLGSAKLN